MKIELMTIVGIALVGIFKDPLVPAINKKQIEASTNLQNIIKGASA